MVTLICRAIYEIVFFSPGAFEFSLTAAYMRGQQVQEAELTELSLLTWRNMCSVLQVQCPVFSVWDTWI